MTLIDSNIIIFATKPEHEALRQFIAEHAPVVSAVRSIPWQSQSKETLGLSAEKS